MTEEKKDEIKVEDSEGYHSSSDTLDIKQIVLRQLQQCIREGGKEMDGGGLRRRIIDGQIVEVVAPNQREIFCNHCDMLWELVMPEIMKHEALVKQRLEDFDKDLENIEKGLNDGKKKATNFITLKKNVDRIDDDHCNRLYNNLLNENKETYELKRANIYKKKLRAISFLLAKIDYFNEKST